MAGSEVPRVSAEQQVATQEGGKDQATQAGEKLSAGSFDYPKMAQAGQGDQAKGAQKPEMGTFEGQTFDVNKLASRGELQAARNEDRAALGIDPSDTSSKTYFDKKRSGSCGLVQKDQSRLQSRNAQRVWSDRQRVWRPS
jgi:hypothetical protein